MFTQMPIQCSIPLDAEGRHVGSLDLLVSDNEHSGAIIPIPIVVLKNGDGPTILLSGGTHGDEDQGQLVIRRLIAELRVEQIRGRIILLPALNLPAVRSHTRVSPIDKGNLNRSYPGDPAKGPTASIAHFVTTQLMPLCDAGIDLHSGGLKTLIGLATYFGISKDEALNRRSFELFKAFGLPYGMICTDGGDGMDDGAHNQGLPFISAELSGGPTADPGPLQAGYDAVKRVLVHLGNLPDGGSGLPPPAATKLLDFRKLGRVGAPFSGLFHPAKDMGDLVEAGEVAGWLYSLEEVDRPPLTLRFPASGEVCMRTAHARKNHGDFLIATAPVMAATDIPGVT